MIVPIEVTTSSALAEIVRKSKESNSGPILVNLTTNLGGTYFLVDNGAMIMDICPKNKRDKTTIFFIFDPINPMLSTAVKLDGALDFIKKRGYNDIMTWFLFNVGLFA